MQNREAIIYDYSLDVRFGDLDSYGHLNSMNYLDLVSTSRLLFMEREMHTKTADLIAKGVGFFLSKATQEFLKPVNGMKTVRVTSHIAQVERARLVIPFEMTDPEKKRIYSRGILEFHVVDLATQKPMEMPGWVADLFFRETT